MILQLITSRHLLKINALFFGYALWFMLSQYQPITRTINVPIMLFQAPQELYIHAPENISVTLQGPRSALRNLDIAAIGAHIDASRITPGYHRIVLSKSNLFLPDTIKLLHLDPVAVIIHATT